MEDERSMRGKRGEYGPEAIALMGASLERAWELVKGTVRDVDLARLIMAGAIIDRVDEGVLDPGDLAAPQQAPSLLRPRCSSNVTRAEPAD